MQPFDTIAMVDWSGGADRGPTPKKDAIWIAVWRDGDVTSDYMRNRDVAEIALQKLIRTERDADRRLLIGFDFPFGYPAGFATALTGRADPLILWEWIAANLTVDGRFHLAGRVNQTAPGAGPFWGNGLKAEIAGLTRKKVDCHPFPIFRQVEAATKGAFSCWQLSGAGCVGSQVLTGLPVLSRLRTQFAPDVAVWPFEALDKPIVFAEVFFSVIADDIRAAMKPGVDPRRGASQNLVARRRRSSGAGAAGRVVPRPAADRARRGLDPRIRPTGPAQCRPDLHAKRLTIHFEDSLFLGQFVAVASAHRDQLAHHARVVAAPLRLGHDLFHLVGQVTLFRVKMFESLDELLQLCSRDRAADRAFGITHCLTSFFHPPYRPACGGFKGVVCARHGLVDLYRDSDDAGGAGGNRHVHPQRNAAAQRRSG